MQALVYSAPLTLELQDVPEPKPGPGEVVVEVAAAGICGSELEGFRSQSPFRVPPLIMGHELAGRRADDGTPVAVNPLIACGACDLCLRGLPNVCRNRALVGIHRAGGFAERVAVPESSLVPLPADADLPRAALIEPFANGVHAWQLALAQDPAIAKVGIVGAGMLGLAVALVALEAGVREVAIADVSPKRLATAASIGVPVTAAALEGEHDVIFDAVGSETTRAASLARLRPGGSTCMDRAARLRAWLRRLGADSERAARARHLCLPGARLPRRGGAGEPPGRHRLGRQPAPLGGGRDLPPPARRTRRGHEDAPAAGR